MRFYLPPILTSKKIYINKKKTRAKTKTREDPVFEMHRLEI